MKNRRTTVQALTLAALVAALVLTGCRAFVPESVIVNKAPETYIIGAPTEEGGGYYHFHVHWYGSDQDGRVERFVWALTDTTVQDEDTTDDEEDLRFNPALDASTLAIGHWTTRTDSVFDFRIDQGSRPSADFTLHIVAVDDMGAFDRTPARLHFFSNTLGTPVISFARVDGNDTIPIATGQADTVGFRRPYTLIWTGSTPNIRGYDDEALARVDTVYPFDDGLFGYKWQILGELGGDCAPSLEDCWSPRKFNEATGDSFSYFGDVRRLTFYNDGTSSTNPFRKLLPSGEVALLVNSIDVAGVEVAEYRRTFSFLVNYDPETIMLDGETDWAHPEDPQVYPYYYRLDDPTRTRVPFSSGDHIPDRTYVVVKALGRDDPRDVRVREEYPIGLQGSVEGIRSNLTGGTFRFATDASVLDSLPAWGEGVDGWYADTLGFMPGPRTTFTFRMQSVDEHGRRDGSPASLEFTVGNPPCVQCVEMVATGGSVLPTEPDCYDPAGGVASCFDDTASFYVRLGGTAADELRLTRPAFIAIDKGNGYTTIVTDTTGLSARNYVLAANVYGMNVILHGKDDDLESWSSPINRVMAWRYQVDHECDPYNQIRDGGGSDDIERVTWSASGGLNPQIAVDPNTGVWTMRVEIAIPSLLQSLGSAQFWNLLRPLYGVDDAGADFIFTHSLIYLGEGAMSVVALDQSQCGGIPDNRPTKYNYFKQVRPSILNIPAGKTWRDCDLPSSPQVPGIKNGLDMGPFAMESLDGVPAVKHFRVRARVNAEVIDCNTQPPRP